MLLLAAASLAFTAGWMTRGGAARSEIVLTQPSAAVAAAVSVPTAPVVPASPAVPTPPAAAGDGAELVNVNTADAERLMTLPGIGEKRAADIVAYREEHGPFAKPEDLDKVEGIGEKTLEDLLPHITTEAQEEIP